MAALCKIVFFIFHIICLTSGSINFTNVKCVEYDTPFATMHQCGLKYMQRGVYAVNIYSKLHQIPVTNVSINLELQRKNLDYRPYLYNITVDFCKLMKNAKRFPIFSMLIDILAVNSNVNHTCPYNLNLELLRKTSIYRPYLYNVTADFCKVMKNVKRFHLINMIVGLLSSNSNVNHTCPFNHDIIMRDMVLRRDIFERFPVTKGDYLLNIRVAAYNKWRACVKVYFTVFDK
ncbi:uncharacterized protein LOC135953771 [Calliphora vicina]|uniref:uncharacterized protein LOC135953771 n=1 Tax=Calliphora vicina TaxID=7373 RepID=UPI00325A4981